MFLLTRAVAYMTLAFGSMDGKFLEKKSQHLWKRTSRTPLGGLLFLLGVDINSANG